LEGAGVEHLDGVEDDSNVSGSDFFLIRDSETGSSTNSDFTFLTTSKKFDDEDTEDKVDNGNDKNDKLEVAGDEHLDGVEADSDGSRYNFVHIQDSETGSSANSDFTFLTTSKELGDENKDKHVVARVEHLDVAEVDLDESRPDFLHIRDSETGSSTNSDFTFLTTSENLDDEDEQDKHVVAGVEHLDVAEVDLAGSKSDFLHIRDSKTGSSTNSDFTSLTTSEKLDDEVEVGNDHDTDVEMGDDHHEDNPENQNGVYNVAPIDYFFISNWSQ
jgi:hypothetical protein